MDADSSRSARLEAENSLTLLERARAGDEEALNALLARYRPRLVRWLHGRIRPRVRTLCDTDDLAQNTLLKAVRNLQSFEPSHHDAFQNYLKRAVANAVRDELRKSSRAPELTAVTPSLPGDGPCPLEQAIGLQRWKRYETALETLSPEDREAIVARFEFGFTHQELASALGKRTEDAARKACTKAIGRLLSAMARLDGTPVAPGNHSHAGHPDDR